MSRLEKVLCVIVVLTVLCAGLILFGSELRMRVSELGEELAGLFGGG